MIDSASAELLAEFRTASTIAHAIIRFSERNNLDAEQTLTAAFPMLRRCIDDGFLMGETASGASPITPMLAAGERLGDGRVIGCLHLLEDTELYRVALANGTIAAAKILRPDASREVADALAREQRVLTRLNGRIAPRLLDAGALQDRRWLLLEWCEGESASVVASGIRAVLDGQAARAELTRLAAAVASTYAALHELGVLHGDVHPGNVLVGPSLVVRIVDFGLSRNGSDRDVGLPRGGVATYFEPEYAVGRRRGRPPPGVTERGEQYAVAALLYEMTTGCSTHDFSVESEEVLRQIEEETPRTFSELGLQPWPAVESLLRRALAKDPKDRFAHVRELADRLDELIIVPPVVGATPNAVGTALVAVLESFVERVSPNGRLFLQRSIEAPTASIAYGAAGIGAALAHIARARDDADLLALADEWVAGIAKREADTPAGFAHDGLGITADLVGTVSPFHSASGIHLVQAEISHDFGDDFSRRQATDAYVTACSDSCDNVDLALGRAGVLLGCARLLEIDGDPNAASLALRSLGERVADSIWATIQDQPPIGEPEGIRSLGIAHGWAGLLYATLRWCAASASSPPATLRHRLEQLADLAQPTPSGVRWPIDTAKPDTMGGWCNGTSGHLQLWILAHRELRDDRYSVLLERAAVETCSSANGVANLCCGLTGQAYALLDAYQHTSEQRWLLAAREIAQRAAINLRRHPDSVIAGSLHKGDGGLAALAAELAHPDHASMPCFG